MLGPQGCPMRRRQSNCCGVPSANQPCASGKTTPPESSLPPLLVWMRRPPVPQYKPLWHDAPTTPTHTHTHKYTQTSEERHSARTAASSVASRTVGDDLCSSSAPSPQMLPQLAGLLEALDPALMGPVEALDLLGPDLWALVWQQLSSECDKRSFIATCRWAMRGAIHKGGGAKAPPRSAGGMLGAGVLAMLGAGNVSSTCQCQFVCRSVA